MRYIEPARTESRMIRSRKCAQKGCRRNTAELKLFCSEHVGQNEYAAKVVAEYAKMTEEKQAVVAGDEFSIDLNGRTVEDILLFLADGEQQASRVAKSIDLKLPAAMKFLQAMKEASLVTLRVTGKGVVYARLTIK